MTESTVVTRERIVIPPHHELIPSQTINEQVDKLGKLIATKYAGDEIVLIPILKGAFIFATFLSQAIARGSANPPLVRIEFMAVRSYGDGEKSSGEVELILDTKFPLRGRHVIFVEDIIDSGLTMTYLLASATARKPASLEVAALLSKQVRRQSQVNIDYLGFEIPDEFVWGYGLDYKGYERNLPNIVAKDKESNID